ncbi:transcriptional regulator PpsR [soil metagenome]
MNAISIAQPDVTLLLDMDGVIREATLSGPISKEGVDGWLGRPWGDTVSDLGGEKVRRMLEDAKARGVSAFRQVTQRFPSGLELPVEYTTLMLGGRAGLIAIGKNLQAVAELQSRLIAAQQAIERDHWKRREIETRYRLLFEASNEAFLVIRASNLRITEANPAAVQALGLSSQDPEALNGREFLNELVAQERDACQAMLQRVREQGKAPGLLVHVGLDRKPWMVRASLIAAETGQAFLLQLASVGTAIQTDRRRKDAVSIEDVVEQAPDGFVVVDEEGVIRRANRAFLELVEVGTMSSVVGESLSRWLWQPGADLSVLLATFHRYRVVRLFATTLHGELGAETEVEISVAGASASESGNVGMVIRDIGRRLQSSVDDGRLLTALGPVTEQIGRAPLRKLVDDTVGVVERHHIKSAIETAGGNRTAAAEILGLSRQSLYAKLKRYGLEQRSATSHEPGD